MSIAKQTHPIYAVVDVETTGLNPRFGDRVCEIGIVLAQGEQITDTYVSLVNPQRPISPGAAAVNGLTDDMVAGAPLFSDIADEVRHRLEGNVLICHNAPFDLGFLQMEFSRLGCEWQAAGVVDTLLLAREFESFPSNSLGNLARYLSLEVQGAHRALADALTTFQLWQYFHKKYGSAVSSCINPCFTVGSVSSEAMLPPPLQEALVQQTDIEIIYVDRMGNETRRLIRPQQVFEEFGTVYLVAYCHLRQDQRMFRLDQIVTILPRGS